MATQRQIEANRRNALRSTGPKTPDGKARSCRNAAVHGLAGEGVAVDDARREGFTERLAQWSAEVGPGSVAADWAVERAVAATFQIEDCERAYDATVADHAARARLHWDADRRAEAAEVARRLHSDPIATSARLETTRHGVEWMLDAWARLADALAPDGTWDDDQAGMALDLLGVPDTFRDGRTPIDAPRGAGLADHRLSLIRRELARLHTLKAVSLDALDALDRRHAESGATAILSRPARLVLRYQRDAWRRYRRAMLDARSPAPIAPDPEPIPEPEPEPIPDPEPPLRGAFIDRALAAQAMADAARTPEEYDAAVAAIEHALASHAPDATDRSQSRGEAARRARSTVGA